MIRRSLFTLFCLSLFPLPLKAELKLPAILSDHMVLQQGKASIWGWASPGKDITVSLAGRKASAKAASDGSWKVSLSLDPGGPHEMKVTGDGALTVQDILVGEVWVGSGQSNMEYPLQRDAFVSQEIPQAELPRIRQFKMDHFVAFEPKTDVAGSWVVCSPSTAKDLSAVAYYFGKRLHKTLNVPVGLVVPSWGGTPAEVWTPRKALDRVPELREHLKRWDSDEEMIRTWKEGDSFDLWISDLKLIPKDPKAKPVPLALEPGKKGLAGQWSANAKPGSSAAFQVAGKGPRGGAAGRFQGVMQGGGWGGFQSALSSNGVTDLTPYQAIEFYAKGKGGKFRLKWGQPSITDYNYHSTNIFTPPSEWTKMSYPLSVFKQGDWGTPKPFTPEAVNLVSFTVEAPYWPDVAAIAYNAMIHPLTPFTVKGAVWYQGESNAGRPRMYQPLLSSLITSWQEAWGARFPFLVVQLPNFMAKKAVPGESGWAELREAQLKTAQAVPGAEIVVTLDLGEANDIHPKNKRDVGDRAALQALRKVYGKKNDFSVPVLEKAQVKGSTMVLTFSDVGAGLTVRGGGPLKGFALAGDDRSFRWADAVVKDARTVEVVSPYVMEPVEVRYAWADNPEGDLVTKSGYPAAPFRYETRPRKPLTDADIPAPPGD